MSRGARMITGIVIAAVVGFLTVAGVGATVLASRLDDSGVDTPTGAVQGFLDSLFTDGDVQAATEHLCEQLRSDNTDDWRELLDVLSNEDQLSWTNVTQASHDGDRATVVADIIVPNGDEVASWTFDVSTDDGGDDDRWYVCGITVR